MAILKARTVKQGNSVLIRLPKEAYDFVEKQGKDVWVLYDSEMDELRELIEVTLLHRKAFKLQQSELLQDFHEFKLKTDERIRRIEKAMV